MRMMIRQVSDLAQDPVISERSYQNEDPTDVAGIFDAILINCSDFISGEGIDVERGIAVIRTMTLTYPGMAGLIEVAIGTDEPGQSIQWIPENIDLSSGADGVPTQEV